MRICEISHFFCYAAYRQKAAAMAQLTGEKELLLTPSGWIEDFHGGCVEVNDSDAYIFKERRAYLNWKVWGGKRVQIFVLTPYIIWDMHNYKPDIIVVDSEPFSLLAFEVAIIRRLFFPRARLIVHSSQNLYKRYPFPFRTTEAFVLHQATAIFVRSEEIKQVLLRKRCGCPIRIITHGVDTKRFTPLVDKERIGYKNGECLHIGYVGALAWHKGVQVLLEAVSDLKIPFKLTIVGNGPERDVLQAQALSLPTSSNIQFKNSVPNAQLPDTLRNFDALVLPSITVPNWKEQFGRIIIESMACGVPVVGSTCGSIPDVIGDGGLVFTEKDAVQLCAILERLAGNQILLGDLSAKARQRALIHFSWERVASRIYSIYREWI